MGFIGPTDYSGLAFLNNDVLTGAFGDLADVYNYSQCNPTDSAGNTITNFFAPNDLIRGGDYVEEYVVLQLQRRSSGVAATPEQGIVLPAELCVQQGDDGLWNRNVSTGSDQSRFLPYLNNADPLFERSRAPFDITQQFKANFTYELPIGQGHKLSSDNKFYAHPTGRLADRLNLYVADRERLSPSFRDSRH